jgi:hypothetical protein
MGAYHLLALWYPSVILGYPLIVLLLGHSQPEGWQFLKANRGFAIGLLTFPFAFIAIRWLMDRLLRLIVADDDPPTAP